MVFVMEIKFQQLGLKATLFSILSLWWWSLSQDRQKQAVGKFL